MSRFPNFGSSAIRERFLDNSSPETVYAYLDENCDDAHGQFSQHPLSEDFQNILFKKNDPIIDLALAKFSNQNSIKKEIFARGDEVLTTALFSNTYSDSDFLISTNLPKWIEADELVTFLESCSHDILKTYFTNLKFAPDGLSDLFQKKEIFDRLSEDIYPICVYFGLMNPYLHKPIEGDFRSPNGYGEYMDSKPFYDAWNLLITLENTPSNARILAEGLEKIIEFQVPLDLSPIGGDSEIKSEESFWAEIKYNDEWMDKFEKELGNKTIKFLSYVFKKWYYKSSDHENARHKDGEEG